MEDYPGILDERKANCQRELIFGVQLSGLALTQDEMEKRTMNTDGKRMDSNSVETMGLITSNFFSSEAPIFVQKSQKNLQKFNYTTRNVSVNFREFRSYIMPYKILPSFSLFKKSRFRPSKTFVGSWIA